jgi:peptidoglycan pentaglycine glycine transferase (the first glycine)
VSVSAHLLDEDHLGDWDALAVDVPGGHVLQSRAWADHRAMTGWRPVFMVAGTHRALALARPWPLVGGAAVYLPRGPVGTGRPWLADGTGGAVGEALVAVADLLRREGIDVVAADPEVVGGDTMYESALRRAGFGSIPEIQPSRHRMALALPGDRDEDAVMSGIAKATRQRIRRAERDGVVVLRHDGRGGTSDRAPFLRPRELGPVALGRFYDLLRTTGDRRGFGFAGPDEFIPWWSRALEAGHLVYLEAREGSRDGEVLGGLVLYRHGSRLSTAHSADPAERRRDHPGTMHLLRWRAIQLALMEGRTEMDLGGVDVAGARRPPVAGEPTFGLYEHKQSFGATWVSLSGAHELVARPWRYGVGRALARAGRIIRGARAGSRPA